eukprot:g6758.t1 g6758   contig23:1157494-1158162(-)
MTITNDDSAPSAPPLSERDIPVVTASYTSDASTLSTSVVQASAVVPPVSSASLPPRPAPHVAVPTGTVAKTVTTTYADGRQVTVTEYEHPGSSATATAAQSFAPRHDLGATPVSITCPYCSHTGNTRTLSQCGDCTWISVIILLLFCFPFFWVPFVCPSCMDTKHYCRNCGRVLGESRAECCNS